MSEDQGFTRSTTTRSGGTFRFAALPPGSYSVAVNSPAGNAAQDNVQIAASATANYTFVVGTSGSEIVVTGARRNLDFSSTTTRSEEHTSELQSLMRISYAVFCLKKKKTEPSTSYHTITHQY